jgi:dihydropteroate synthase
MNPAAATRDPRFGRDAQALAARSLSSPTGDASTLGEASPRATCRIAFRPVALAPDDRAALSGVAGSQTIDGMRESVWVGSAESLTQLAQLRPALVPLQVACEGRIAPLPTPRVMGIVNVTPDSFSDGGRFLDPAHAAEQGLALVRDGADLLDIGGESTRPGAASVSADEELARVVPVLERLAAEVRVPLSIDTTKAAVAERALDLGASFVNDVSAGTLDAGMLPLVAERGCDYCVMHMLGTPRTMQNDPVYEDPVAEILERLRSRVGACLDAGVEPSRIVIDPGIGFGKLVEHNVELLQRLGELRSLGLPLLVGVSNKSFLGRLVGESRALSGAGSRTGATAAAVTACVFGGVEILRVHDVRTMVQAVRVAARLRSPRGTVG